MKKILFVLALVASMQLANAQGAKSLQAAKAAVDAAKVAVDNVKKNTKAATWLKYGEALAKAYDAPQGALWIGMSQQDLALLGGGEKAQSVEQVVANGTELTKQVFANKNLYFDQKGTLSVIEVTKPVVENALEKALEAYKQAAKLDADGKSTKDIVAGIKGICDKYTQDAYNNYTLGNSSVASKLFEKAAEASKTAPYNQLDTNAIYNAGFTAWQAGELERAKGLFEDCNSYGYYGDDGETFSKLADIAEKTGNSSDSKKYLEEGFEKFPQSQGILVGLINYYLTNNEDTGRLFTLLDQAKKNEPNNASLYYVEGNIHEKLGELDEAVASYNKCSEINPEYEFGYIGKGIHYYNLAVDLQDKAAQELNDAKYMALSAEFEKALKSCIEPFEKAFEISKDNEVKQSVAEYLKNACFRFRTDETADYNAKYEKYNKFLAGE